MTIVTTLLKAIHDAISSVFHAVAMLVTASLSLVRALALRVPGLAKFAKQISDQVIILQKRDPLFWKRLRAVTVISVSGFIVSLVAVLLSPALAATTAVATALPMILLPRVRERVWVWINRYIDKIVKRSKRSASRANSPFVYPANPPPTPDGDGIVTPDTPTMAGRGVHETPMGVVREEFALDNGSAMDAEGKIIFPQERLLTVHRRGGSELERRRCSSSPLLSGLTGLTETTATNSKRGGGTGGSSYQLVTYNAVLDQRALRNNTASPDVPLPLGINNGLRRRKKSRTMSHVRGSDDEDDADAIQENPLFIRTLLAFKPSVRRPVEGGKKEGGMDDHGSCDEPPPLQPPQDQDEPFEGGKERRGKGKGGVASSPPLRRSTSIDLPAHPRHNTTITTTATMITSASKKSKDGR
uniref:Uncharacterized protein n=3 Tax=Lotharella globosa TaxID=91324 RepID=A0A6V3LLL3_9EUKA